MSAPTNPSQQLLAPAAPVTTGSAFNPLDFDDDHDEPTARASAAGPAVTTAAPAATTAAPAPPDQAVAAVAAPTEDTPETVAEVETDEQRAARERAEQIAHYARRRRKYTRLVLLAAAVLLWYAKPWSGLSLPGLPGAASHLGVHTTTQADQPSATAVIAADMSRIHQRLERTGDLTGMRLAGAQVAAAGTSMYVARTLEGQCVVYGVAKGADLTPQADQSGQACAGEIKSVQAQLDAEDANQRNSVVTAAQETLVKAADAAKFYASQNYIGGAPSLTGLPATGLDGATIVADHGTWAQLKAVTGNGICRTAIIAADGTLGEISPC